MAVVSKSLTRGAFATSLADLYTVPNTSTTSVLTNIVVTNTTNSIQTFNILLDNVELFANSTIPAYGIVSLDLKQALNADATPKKIRGFASAITVKYHISGAEIV
jgi:hypothetical protein